MLHLVERAVTRMNEAEVEGEANGELRTKLVRRKATDGVDVLLLSENALLLSANTLRGY